MRGLPENVPWKRFWIPRETAPALDGDGYLVDPESGYGKVASAQARTLEQLEETPCVALLGEPGIGKSWVIEAYCESVRADADIGEVLVADFRWHHDLKQKIFSTSAFTRWRDEGAPLTLLLDSLDEYPEGANEAARQLIGELHGGRLDRLRLRVACRSAEWPGTLDEQLLRLWKRKSEEEPSKVAFYALAPLRRADVALAAGQDATGFFAEVDRVGAQSLAIKPITLAFLLDEFRLHRELPRERVTLYEEACRRLCGETSRSRAARHRTGALHIEARLAIASRIAAVRILSRRSLVQVGVVRGAVAPEMVRLDEMVGGVEPSQVGHVPVTADAISEVLEVSGLFAPRAAGYVGWAHQTYAEFLAARFLQARELPPAQMLRELSNHEMGRAVPALRETIAWLASMNKAFFQHLIFVDPEPLLESDFAGMEAEDREALVYALLDRINKRELDASIIQHNRQAQVRLAHPNLGDQLRPYLTERDRYIRARLAAIDLAVGCKVEALQSCLVALVLDASDDDNARSAAARAVVRIGSRETKRRLKPLVFGECGRDPDDALKGYALKALWSEDLSAAELFANLTPPKSKSYSGSYGSFLHELKKSLMPAVLTDALRWTMGVPARHSEKLSFAFIALLDEILKKGWEHIQDVKVRVSFAEAVRQRVAVHDGIFELRSHNGKDDPDLERDDCRRCLLTSALVALPPRDEFDAFDYMSRGLVLPRDVPWVIEQLRAELSSPQRGVWAAILDQIARRYWNFEVLDPIIGALSDIEELRRAMPYLPLCVEIDSAESQSMRRDEQKAAEADAEDARYVRKRRKKKPPPVGKRLRECLSRFDDGDDDAGWKLHH